MGISDNNRKYRIIKNNNEMLVKVNSFLTNLNYNIYINSWIFLYWNSFFKQIGRIIDDALANGTEEVRSKLLRTHSFLGRTHCIYLKPIVISNLPLEVLHRLQHTHAFVLVQLKIVWVVLYWSHIFNGILMTHKLVARWIEHIGHERQRRWRVIIQIRLHQLTWVELSNRDELIILNF